MLCGEGGIRTLGTPVGAHTLSRRARSTAPAPLQELVNIRLLSGINNLHAKKKQFCPLGFYRPSLFESWSKFPLKCSLNNSL